MKRLFILVCAVVIGAAGLGIGIGCQGGGAIEFGEAPTETTTVAEDAVLSADQLIQAAAGDQQAQICLPADKMPVITTTTVTDKGDPEVEGGFPGLMSYAPDSDLMVRIDEGILSFADLIRDKAKPDEGVLDVLDKIEMLYSDVSEAVVFASFEMVMKEVEESVSEEPKPEEEELVEKADVTEEEKEEFRDEMREGPEPSSGGILFRARAGVDITALVDEKISKLLEELNSKSKEGEEKEGEKVWQARILDERTFIVSPFAESIKAVEARMPNQLSLTYPISRFDGSTKAPAIYAVLSGKSKIFNPKNIDSPEIAKMVSLADDRNAIAGIDLTGGVFYAYVGAMADGTKPMTYLVYYLNTKDELIEIAIKALSEKIQQEDEEDVPK